MNLKFVIVGIIVILASFSLRAQDNPESVIHDFFENYETEGASLAVEKLYATNPWTSRIQDAINNVKTHLERFNEELVGKYYGYEKLTTKKLGDSYVLYSYFMKFDRQFLRLTFQFYKPNKEWRLASFQFDDNFDEEIEEAAKLYYQDLDLDK
ncbi:MAG TPA: hypothetical protein VJ951_16495 [Bacteroidales bacterium]|nr:hypothetical protein [Bacteroidales bacterium]